jgi:hypothetical protein
MPFRRKKKKTLDHEAKKEYARDKKTVHTYPKHKIIF